MINLKFLVVIIAYIRYKDDSLEGLSELKRGALRSNLIINRQNFPQYINQYFLIQNIFLICFGFKTG